MADYLNNVFGIEQAKLLVSAGWKQGQIFKQKELLPDRKDDTYFIVCTQSCSVVSSYLQKDPFLEIASAKVLLLFDPKCPQARGKDVRKFHIPITGASFKALEIDVNSRQFIAREQLLNMNHAGLGIADEKIRDFAGWLARYYSRIALPDELGVRLRKTIFVQLKKFLEATSGRAPAQVYDGISSIWIQYAPDSELGDGQEYTVRLLFICDDASIAENFDRALLAVFGGQQSLVIDGISFHFEFNTPDEMRLSDLQNWQRLSEWDYLSSLGDVATIPVEV